MESNCMFFFFFFFFKQKTAYEISSRDWSSDVCSSDLQSRRRPCRRQQARGPGRRSACRRAREIGRASCRERVCELVYISAVSVSLEKKRGQHRCVRRARLRCLYEKHRTTQW